MFCFLFYHRREAQRTVRIDNRIEQAMVSDLNNKLDAVINRHCVSILLLLFSVNQLVNFTESDGVAFLGLKLKCSQISEQNMS